jgi:hypothetical protein
MSSSRHLLNPLANLNQLVDSPSRKDGINYILERDLRFCKLTKSPGIRVPPSYTVIPTKRAL